MFKKAQVKDFIEHNATEIIKMLDPAKLLSIMVDALNKADRGEVCLPDGLEVVYFSERSKNSSTWLVSRLTIFHIVYKPLISILVSLFLDLLESISMITEYSPTTKKEYISIVVDCIFDPSENRHDPFVYVIGEGILYLIECISKTLFVDKVITNEALKWSKPHNRFFILGFKYYVFNLKNLRNSHPF